MSTGRPTSPSLIPWLYGADLPEDWYTSKVKHLAPQMRAGETITAESIEEIGLYPVYGGNGLRGYTGSRTHSGTRILIGRQGALCGNVHLVRGEFWASEHAIVVEPRDDVDPRWFAYLLRVMDLGQYSQTVAQPGIGTTQINALEVPVPSPGEQRAIADFLDRETARIDRLITEQQRLIDLLRERRETVSSVLFGHRVGHGDRLKWRFSERDDRARSAANELPLMSVSISWGVRRRDEVTDDEARAEDLAGYKICRRGELVINRMRAFQGALGIAPEDGIVSPDYAVLCPGADVDGDWLASVMRCDVFVGEMARRIKGIGSADLGSARTPRINISDLAEIRVDVPSTLSQVDELQKLRSETVKIDSLLVETEKFIELSQERRSALITAAVTGQIDVRDEVA
ncbi:restriction endonuclease subunit S [Mycolicibacillus parakoreensis]|uniref:Restriction endonuclease subunit S n=1 Tax=Mycolicibacillus parakoreensis TaxID=1069221 RepID=A0ABY3TYT6_9MYCO|nr:restriction endonuclease subunit S [Mycolicibacillus parakoreensis]MCV7316640.1 restriction endonuclease subunit S [Mycolicibacillus parakoreensis]ULN52850.1 restriction endonuclease subunit S [Mycolicibacillus parakoreensis]